VLVRRVRLLEVRGEELFSEETSLQRFLKAETEKKSSSIMAPVGEAVFLLVLDSSVFIRVFKSERRAEICAETVGSQWDGNSLVSSAEQ